VEWVPDRPGLECAELIQNDGRLRAIELVWYAQQPEKDSCVQIAGEEYKQSKIRDPSRLVISQVSYDEELRQYEC
jgi:hypothetical protein